MDPLTSIYPVRWYPAVFVLRGSTIKRVVWGFGRPHARRRAERWIEKRGW